MAARLASRCRIHRANSARSCTGWLAGVTARTGLRRRDMRGSPFGAPEDARLLAAPLVLSSPAGRGPVPGQRGTIQMSRHECPGCAARRLARHPSHTT